ncbi:DUF2783 domain-containing protein [Paremcibacter congregatus]|jgi:hypothetical protein|uniref:DUF2783 domain-containing protein n=1 Tax=Paremcibacter congregatus TaxID=2043170 RepID=A0A2G4YQ47_9PROT|nr:DUF2783 domain-containing protein [Paremcibacter congregatus]PHZ84451.1 hypothetical protein CRD36_11610 [Paremcibacter congregatus]QDE28669.1 DUF2783 domain-containing protein [Paremcibacter congregatus]|tara:strand:- start:5 stop:196 length:192 start_codon:yes stop_codon:yes gene_type:complete
MSLNVKKNIARPDDFYQELIDLQRGLDETAVERMNARLILLLANHIGDHDVLTAAMKAARGKV